MTQTLEQLSAAATQGLIEAEDELLWSDEKYAKGGLYGASRKGKAPMADFDDGEYTDSPNPTADAAFIAALWNAYRTGQLVASQGDDAMVGRLENSLIVQMEAQADDTTPSSVHKKQGRVWIEGWFDLKQAVAAMKDTQP